MGFFSKIFSSPVAKIALPVAASIIAPGIGTALSSGLGLGLGAAGSTALGSGALGTGMGFLGGQNIGQALKGGALSAGLSYGGSMLGEGLADTALGRGLSDLQSGLADTALGRGVSDIYGGLRGAVSGVTDSLGLTSPYAYGGAASGGGWINPDYAATNFGNYAAGGAGYAPSAVGGGIAPAVGGGGGLSSLKNIGTILQLGSGLNSYLANESARKAMENYQSQYLNQLQPYQTAGLGANTRLSELLGIGGNTQAEGYGSLSRPFTPSDLANEPGYQFQLQQGANALANSAAAKGGFLSGAAQKELADYSQNLANTTYQQAYEREMNRRQNIYNQLAGMKTGGLTAAGAMGEPLTNIGLTNAASTVNKSNLIGSTLSSLLNKNNQGFGFAANQSPAIAQSNRFGGLSGMAMLPTTSGRFNLGSSLMGGIIGYNADGTPIYSNSSRIG